MKRFEARLSYLETRSIAGVPDPAGEVQKVIRRLWREVAFGERTEATEESTVGVAKRRQLIQAVIRQVWESRHEQTA